MTRVGLWYLVFLAIVALAATNTGNNGLFLVWAVMGAALLVSERLAWWNVRRFEIDLETPREIFANRLGHVELEIAHRGRWGSRWWLTLAVEPSGGEPGRESADGESHPSTAPIFVPHLLPRTSARLRLELLARRRGRLLLGSVHVTSLFPLGFFKKGRRYAIDRELLVFPEIFAPSPSRPGRAAGLGDQPSRRPGWGHDLIGLRRFRQGDDPRAIHWKQTARTGDLIVKQRESEQNRRLLIVLDNAVGALSAGAEKRFERLISEAATAALDYLDWWYEVALLTRDGSTPFASGARQRFLILETLALIEARPETAAALEPPGAPAPHLRLVMDPVEAVA